MASILSTMGRDLLKTAFEASPILLKGGVAQGIPGHIAPIILYTEAVALLTGLISGGIEGKLKVPDLDHLWCSWLPGTKNALITNQICSYPFANNSIAANAVMAQPLKISMTMHCPAHGAGAMLTKLATLQALQAILSKHSFMGGSFIVITPGQIYTDMLLTDMIDSTAKPEQSPATDFTFNFTRPLTLKSEAQERLGTMAAAASGGSVTDGSWGLGSGNLLETPLTWAGII